jgi:hypothetical protein
MSVTNLPYEATAQTASTQAQTTAPATNVAV